MPPRRPSTTLFLAGVILLAGLLAGCGGGDQAGNGSQDGGSEGTKQRGGEAAKKEGNRAVKKKARPGARVALGTVGSVNLESRGLTLQPSTPVQGKGPIPFKIARNATVTLDDEEAELAQVERGQQAQITYILRNEVNVARQVALISGG